MASESEYIQTVVAWKKANSVTECSSILASLLVPTTVTCPRFRLFAVDDLLQSTGVHLLGEWRTDLVLGSGFDSHLAKIYRVSS
jgi:hypothetical protein